MFQKRRRFLGYNRRRQQVRTHCTFLLVLCTLMMLFNITTAFAAGLNDMAGSGNSDSSSIGNGASFRQSTDEGLLQGLNDSVNYTGENEMASQVKEPLKNLFGFIVQIGSYILTGGVVAITVLDLCYVCLPPLRGLLGCGQQGAAPAQGASPGMGGMGMGGFGGGMGMRPMGGFGGGMGGMGGMGSPMGGMPGAQGMQSPGGFKWVTDQAVTAVACAGQPGPDGKPQSPLAVYAKSMVVTLVFCPVLLVLAVSGVLGNLGFAIGSLIGGLIQTIIGALGG